MKQDPHAALRACAAGETKRPRGNAVLPEEHAASAPFAKACADLLNDSLGTTYGLDEDDFEGDPTPGADLIYGPPEALPPLP